MRTQEHGYKSKSRFAGFTGRWGTRIESGKVIFKWWPSSGEESDGRRRKTIRLLAACVLSLQRDQLDE